MSHHADSADKVFSAIALFGFILLSHCGGSSSPATPVSLPVSVEGLDGSSDVAVDSSFSYGFTKAVDSSTVTTSTFFLVATPSPNIAVGIKASVDTSICNISNALAASVSYSAMTTTTTLDPTEDLSAGTSYSICLLTDIDYADGTSFEGFMATFTTVAASSSASCTAPTCSAIHTLILASDATGIRPSTSFTTVTMPEFTSCTSTPTLSMTGLPSSMSFDTSSRALSLASGSTTIASTDATSAITATYTATIGSTTAASVQCTLNDMDGDTIIDHTEYSLSEVPFSGARLGYIQLTDATKSLYRPVSGSIELTPNGVVKPTEGLDLTDSTDASADFDGDGDTNLAEITAGTNIFVAESTGLFASAISYTAQNSPLSPIFDDLDEDGDMDLVVNNSDSNSLSVFLGTGNGTFGSATNSAVGGAGDSAHWMSGGDFDKDGDLDLAVTDIDEDEMHILFGGGNGTFSKQTTHTVGDGPRLPQNADFDGDGDLDLAISNTNSQNVQIMLNNGGGSFSGTSTYSVGAGSQITVAGDFDNDGDLDLAAPNSGAGVNTVSVLLNQGDAAFASAVNSSAGTTPIGISTGDFDDDGNLDLAVNSVTVTVLTVLLGNGDGTFDAGESYDGFGGPGVATGDFDGDGDIDIAGVNYTGNTMTILLGDGDGTFTESADYATGSGPGLVSTADFDEDGDLDIVVSNNQGTTISVFINQ